MSKQKHLVTTGPVDVRAEILQAQTAWMIGHRGKAFEELFASIQSKLKQTFFTDSRVFLLGSSGTGFWEGASRNGIRDDKKALHLVGGAFSERWAQISQANAKDIDIIEVPWGQAHTPEMVAEALKKQKYDAVCMVHNETSTGVTNPVKAISDIVRQYDDTFLYVDTVSGIYGTEFRMDEWGVDIALTSSQKALALPPGLAFAAVSDRVLARAKDIKYRGYYFDFIEIEKMGVKNNTPSTPPISLMYALEAQLNDIVAEGMENRWQRHAQMREMTANWITGNGFGFFAPEGYRSNTVTCIDNTRNMDVDAMAKFMSERGFSMDKGYGKAKGKTFRIGHMGDMQTSLLEEILALLDDYLKS